MTLDLDRLAEIMHDAYERAAARNGWETQERSRKPWADVPEANKATMRAAVSALLSHITSNDPQPLLDELREQLRDLGDRANDDAANAISDEAAEYFGGKAVAFLRAAELVQAALDKAREAK